MGDHRFSSQAVRLLGVAGYLARRSGITSADQIAEFSGTSTRTAYRDVEDLRELGLAIEGEFGVGYSARREDVEHWLNALVYRNPVATKAKASSLNNFERRATMRGTAL